MNYFEILTIFDAVYIIYILNYFKTKYSLAHPLTYFEKNKYLYHPIGKSNIPINNICPFGHSCSWLLSGFILIRLLLLKYTNVSTNLIRNFSFGVLIITIIFSLLNFNDKYLVPHFIIETLVIKNILLDNMKKYIIYIVLIILILIIVNTFSKISIENYVRSRKY